MWELIAMIALCTIAGLADWNRRRKLSAEERAREDANPLRVHGDW